MGVSVGGTRRGHQPWGHPQGGGIIGVVMIKTDLPHICHIKRHSLSESLPLGKLPLPELAPGGQGHQLGCSG